MDLTIPCPVNMGADMDWGMLCIKAVQALKNISGNVSVMSHTIAGMYITYI